LVHGYDPIVAFLVVRSFHFFTIIFRLIFAFAKKIILMRTVFIKITKISLLFQSLLIATCFAQSNEVYENKAYRPYVKTVQLYPVTGAPDQELHAPIVTLDQTSDLLLQFDLLQEEYVNLQAKIIHCNANWTKSKLSDLEFLSDYNEFIISDFEYSVNTRQLYVNYWMNLPKVNRTGNYVVMVYVDNDPKNVLLTRRFIVYENKVYIDEQVNISKVVRDRSQNQQVDFTVGYDALGNANPSQFSVVLRQNGRWDNAIFGLKPSMIQPGQKQMEYRHMSGENNFAGGSEFRFVDIRGFSFAGQNVGLVDKTGKLIAMQVTPDVGRADKYYSQIRDFNGGYIITTVESGASYLSCDYFDVMFTLKATASLEPVYVIGAFNDWKKDEASLMTYDPTHEEYHRTIQMKQGKYDYCYWVVGQNPFAYDGSYYQTENQYEIIVYFRPFSGITDEVVGYRSFSSQF